MLISHATKQASRKLGLRLRGKSAVRAFTLAVESPLVPGLRILNTCGPRACVGKPVAEVLRAWFGEECDLSHYEQPGHEWDAVYDVTRIREELGFVAEKLPANG